MGPRDTNAQAVPSSLRLEFVRDHELVEVDRSVRVCRDVVELHRVTGEIVGPSRPVPVCKMYL